jgi:hypothetical protein
VELINKLIRLQEECIKPLQKVLNDCRKHVLNIMSPSPVLREVLAHRYLALPFEYDQSVRGDVDRASVQFHPVAGTLLNVVEVLFVVLFMGAEFVVGLAFADLALAFADQEL